MARKGIDVFNITAKGQYIYQQYQRLEWLKKYAKFIDDYIQTNYFDKLSEMWDTINVAESLDPYLTFYTRYLFGLHRPLGGASITDFYDLDLLYDNARIYDDSQEADGLIDGEQYLKYIKFIYDYTYETWQLDHILAFVANYLGDIDPTDIYIDFSTTKNTIKIRIPAQSVAVNDFIKLTIKYYDEMCLPFPAVLDFVLKQESDTIWRGIKYSPYNAVYNQFPAEWANNYGANPTDYSMSENVVYDGVSVSEGRVYQCLQEDKSISYENLTPQNFSNTAFWTKMKYSIGEFVIVFEDAFETDSTTSTTPLYTAGIYKCIADDYDIDLKKAQSFTSQPTSLNEVDDAENALPACFNKFLEIAQADGSKKRVSIALKKWQRIADLPTKN